MHALSRAAILSRYRRYRDLRMDIQTAALESIPHSSFLAHAKRIGLSDGKVLFTDDIVELSLAFDLAVYTASAGRTRHRPLRQKTAGDFGAGRDACSAGLAGISVFDLPHDRRVRTRRCAA